MSKGDSIIFTGFKTIMNPLKMFFIVGLPVIQRKILKSIGFRIKCYMTFW